MVRRSAGASCRRNLHYWRDGPARRTQPPHRGWLSIAGTAASDLPNRHPQAVTQEDGLSTGGPTRMVWSFRCLALETSVGHCASHPAGNGKAGGAAGSGGASGNATDSDETDDAASSGCCCSPGAGAMASSARSSATKVARVRASAPGKVRSTNSATKVSVQLGPRNPSAAAAPVIDCSVVASAAARADEAAAVMAADLTHFRTTPEPQRPSNWIA